MVELQKLLEMVIEKKASDLHITTGALPRSGLGLAKRLESLHPETGSVKKDIFGMFLEKYEELGAKLFNFRQAVIKGHRAS
jgi:Tfp pilus assembly pilus retraction ATPase PilT